jgi:hypothetical protein
MADSRSVIFETGDQEIRFRTVADLQKTKGVAGISQLELQLH